MFGPGDDFFAYLRDSFDLLYEEGAERPRMMSIGLHMRLTGHPGRAKALIRFIEYIASRRQVWICRREDIARHWIDALSARLRRRLSALTQQDGGGRRSPRSQIDVRASASASLSRRTVMLAPSA